MKAALCSATFGLDNLSPFAGCATQSNKRSRLTLVIFNSFISPGNRSDNGPSLFQDSQRAREAWQDGETVELVPGNALYKGAL